MARHSVRKLFQTARLTRHAREELASWKSVRAPKMRQNRMDEVAVSIVP
jgi:hypothetical protein